MLLTVDNITQPIEEWALDYGIPCSLIRNRINNGWDPERAVTTPMRTTGRRLKPSDMQDVQPRSKPRTPVKYLTFEGETLTLKQWAERRGLKTSTIHWRLNNGWPLERVLREDAHNREMPIEHNGQARTVTEWAEMLGISPVSLRSRLDRGWPVERAFSTSNVYADRKPARADLEPA